MKSQLNYNKSLTQESKQQIMIHQSPSKGKLVQHYEMKYTKTQ